ncbi:MAG: hypothetical protein IJD91_05665 [Clostridia bacterium]|nr:hypothetical protein [Clostridia bacterium]
MKKFMKAIAFATVMCLVLSTAAFAAVEVTDYATKTVAVTVEGVQKGEQVAIIITRDGANFTKENILFVDQKAAGTSTAVFNTAITADVETVDVYAGFASNALSSAVLVANDVELTAAVEISITLSDVQIKNDITEAVVDGETSTVDPDTKGAVVYLKVSVANATAGDIEGMAWVFEVENDDTKATATKYAAADANIVAALGSVLTGDVEIAAALDSTGYTVTGAKVLLSVNGEEVELVKE